MQYTPIPPLNYIEQVTEKTNTIFMLAQLWQIEQYRKAIRNSQLETIVLDNGAYEGEIVTDEQLVTVIENTVKFHRKAKIYPIIPDEMKDPEKTLERTEAFFEYLNDINLPENVSLLGVIQVDPNLDQKSAVRQSVTFARRLLRLAEDYSINMGGFAIPIWFQRVWGDRERFGHALRLIFDNIYLHALGLDDLNELRQLKNVYDSVDTSLPFTLAYYEKTFDQIQRLDPETKRRLNIGRVPLKEEVPENNLYMENLETVLKVIK